MKTTVKTLSLSLLTLMATTFASFAADDIPQGWFKAGSHPKHYEIKTEKKVLSIKNTETQPEGFTTLMQSIQARKYVGKRIRFSANVKSQGLQNGWAGLWMRIDGKDDQTLGFDNMSQRAIRGTTPWKNYSVVLDIPADSHKIAFGVLSSGSGEIFVKDISFEVVDTSVETTDMTKADEPENLKLN